MTEFRIEDTPENREAARQVLIEVGQSQYDSNPSLKEKVDPLIADLAEKFGDKMAHELAMMEIGGESMRRLKESL